MNIAHAKRVWDFQQLQRTVPITAVLARYNVELKRVGTQLFGACPVHRGSNTKQFVVDPDKNLWRCFGDCNRGGSTIELVSAIEGIEIKAAAALIASWFAIAPRRQREQHRKQRRKPMSENQRPTMKAFVVEDRAEGDERDAFWTRVGSAWPHKDGKGLNVQLATGVAVSGRLVLREYTEADQQEDEKKGSKFTKKK